MPCRVLAALALLAAPSWAQDFPVPSAPVHQEAAEYVLADLDLDGRTDIITANDVEEPDAPDVSVTLAGPDGHFPAPAPYVTAKWARDVAAGLIDGDGQPDVAACHEISQTVVVLRGLGGGALGPPVSYFVGGQLRNLELGDLDGDGALDLVTFSASGAGEVHVN